MSENIDYNDSTPIGSGKPVEKPVDRVCGTCHWRGEDGLCEAFQGLNMPVEQRGCDLHVTDREAEIAGCMK